MLRKIFPISTILAFLPLSLAFAAGDVPGAKDPAPINARFPEAVITAQSVKDFDEFTLITGPVAKEGQVDSGRTLEGRITMTTYEIPKERSTLEVFRNYEKKLSDTGFEVLYECSDRDCGGRNFNLTAVPYSHGFGGNENGQRYLAGVLAEPGTTIFVSLYIAKNYSGGGETKDRVYVRLVLVEVEPMTTELVTVDAEEMQQEISESGHVALYGIHFAFDSAEILPESQSALEEIAKLMTENPALSLLVVGHTDNVGTFDYNFDLSKRRAAEVRAALIGNFGIAADRLEAHGVAFLSPIAPNASEDGRARNRRVELVQR